MSAWRQQVLRGARLLAEHRPTVVLEHAATSAAHLAPSSADIHGMLTEPGLRVFDIDGGGPLREAEFVAAAQRGRLWTFVAQ